MTKNLVSSERRVSIVANVAALVVVGGILTWFGFTAQAQEQTSAPQRPVEVLASAASPADLERAFWLCDYAGTNGGVDSGAAATCSAVTEELKIRNFNGDFDAMVAWWRQHKPAKHQALKAVSRTSAGVGKSAPAPL